MTVSPTVIRALGRIHQGMLARGYQLLLGPRTRAAIAKPSPTIENVRVREYVHADGAPGWMQEAVPRVRVEWSLPSPQSTPRSGCVRCTGTFRWDGNGPIHVKHYHLPLDEKSGWRKLDELEALYDLAQRMRIDEVVADWERRRAEKVLSA